MAALPPGIDLSTIPLATPPPGITSNFVNPQSLATTTLVIGNFLLVVTVFVVIVRLFSNYHATRGLGWDDFSCVIATFLFLVFVGTTFGKGKTARHGYDTPIALLTPSEIKKFWVQCVTAGPLTFFAKAALFLLYYRVFKLKKFIRYAIIFGIAFSFLFYSAATTYVAVLVAPKVGHHWDLISIANNGTNRGGATAVGITVAMVNSALDILLLILPIPVIWSLQLSVKKKIGINAIFMVGLFALTASIVSLVYRVKLWQKEDSAWVNSICSIGTIVEAGVTIICSSMSALVTFWKAHIATYIPPIYSHFRSYYDKVATRFKFDSRASGDTQTCPHGSKQSKLYVELDEYPQESIGFPANTVRTEIGGGSPAPEAEKGVIRKSTKVEQSFN